MNSEHEKFNLIVILGATASGKTALAVQAAKALDGEILSADSRQVYRGMDLGTGKDLAEYGEVPSHLIDIAEAGAEYNVFSFQRDFFDAFAQIQQRGRRAILCGGTGLYLDAVLRGYRLIEVAENPELRRQLEPFSDQELRQRLQELKPELHNRTDLDERPRLLRAIEIAKGEQAVLSSSTLPPLPQVVPLVFGLRWPRDLLRRRIALRLQQRFDAGMIEEVQALHDAGVSWHSLEFYGLEYRLIAQHLQGQLNRNDMQQKLCSAIGQFAKRQATFFRRMEKHGVEIHWLEGQGEPFAELHQILAPAHLQN